jgi:hypothetical protein
MLDVTIKLSDGVREITVESQGDGTLDDAEATAIRLYSVVVANSPTGQRAGFTNWALGSDTERSPEE